MEISIETALFIIAIVWFLLVTIIFLTTIKISLENDEVKKLKTRIDGSQKKLSDIHKKIGKAGQQK